MSLLTVVRDVCAVVGVELPTSVFTSISANRTMQEMVALANEMAQRIAYDTRDWTELQKAHTFLGADIDPDPNFVVGQGVYPLPADYKRMLLSTNLWRSTSSQRPLKFISDPDEWVQRQLANDNDTPGSWAKFGNEIHFSPGLTPGESVKFVYLEKNCIALTSGGFGDRFQADTDTFRLDERLLKLGMTYDWKMKKGSPYAEDMGTYQDAINMVAGHDKPAPIIIGRRTMSDMWWGGHA
jgi:hypothetical protein